jgi:hypothetical protein
MSQEEKYFDAFDVQPYNEENLTAISEKGNTYYIDGDAYQTEIINYYANKPYRVDEGCDWRELIYQMALDYRKLYHDDDFLYNL